MHVYVCVHRSVKTLRKLHFAFRRNDDDVEWKTCSPASVLLLLRSLGRERRVEERWRGRVSPMF